MRAPALPRGREGFTLVEVLVASIIVAMIGAAIAVSLGATFDAWSWSDRKGDLVQQGRFAMDRMVFWTRMTNRILLPFQYRYKDAGITRDVLAVAGCGQSAFDADGAGVLVVEAVAVRVEGGLSAAGHRENVAGDSGVLVAVLEG
ncbi:MAG: type II secretion system GspH family protein [Candidatus Methylomirabilis sp.]|nr:type II secretion system GspH family protein [Deltaproteobacteria bacterium]